jgi:hypothetical protein
LNGPAFNVPFNDDFAIDPSLLDVHDRRGHTDGSFNGYLNAHANGHAPEQASGSGSGHVSGHPSSHTNAQAMGHALSPGHTFVYNGHPHYPINGEIDEQPLGEPNHPKVIPATLPPHPNPRFTFHGAEQEAGNDPVLALLKTARSTPGSIPDYAALLPGPEVRGRPGFWEARDACGAWYDETRKLALPVTISPELREYVRLLAPRGKEKIELYERLKTLRQPPPVGYADPAKERKHRMEIAVLQAMIEEAQAHVL